MRSERQEITHRGRRRTTLTAEWWRPFSILWLLLAATAIVSPAQNDPHSVTFTDLVNFDGIIYASKSCKASSARLPE